MEPFEILVIYTISFLDSLCFGLIMPVLNPHLLTIGSCHVILGTLASLQILLQSVAGPLTRTLIDKIGKKWTLIFELCFALVTNVLLGYMTVHWEIFILRCIFYVTNQTQTICKYIVSESASKDTHSSLYGVMGALGSFGFVAGPILGGHLYEMENGFLYVTQLASVTTVISLLLCMFLPNKLPEKKDPKKDDQPSKKPTTFTEKVKEQTDDFKSSLKSVDFHKEWDVLTVQYLIAASMTAFFSKFSIILRTHFKSSQTTLGYIVAFHSVSMFFSAFAAPFVDLRSNEVHEQKLKSLSGLLLAVVGVCSFQSYDFYLIAFFGLALMKNVVTSVQKNTCASRSKKDYDVTRAADAFDTLASVITPLFLGIACDLFGHYGVKCLAVFPLIFCIIIVLMNGKPKKVEVDGKED